MKTALILARTADQLESTNEATKALHAAGYEVHVATWTQHDRWLESSVDEVHWLTEHIESYPPAYFRGNFRGPRGRWAWDLVSRHAETMRIGRTADLIIALEFEMIFSAWEFAQVNPTATVVHGLHPALRSLRTPPAAEPASTTRDSRSDAVPADRAGSHAERVPFKRRARSYAGRAKRRLQAATDSSRRVEARLAADEALVNDFLTEMASERGSIDAAVRTARATALSARVATTRVLADLWGGLVGHDLGAGDTPADLLEAVRTELAWADELLDSGDHDAAAGSFHQATRLLFHRAVHFDSTTSPLADDPAGYTKILRSSRVYRGIVRNRGRAEKAVIPPHDRPTRVLIATDGNTNFVQDLHEHLADVHEVEVRFIEPKDLAKARRFIGSRRHLVRTQLAGTEAAAAAAEEDLREHLDWADVVFGDWCTGMAWYLTLIDPGTTRVILRLHSYEAWTLWPHLIDFSRVDVLVFVSEHLKELTQRAVPGVATAGTTVVVPNAMNLQRFTLPKDPAARHTVGMLGFNVVAKDLQWTLEVLRRLRSHDDRYRLKLIGGSFDAAGTPALRKYRDEALRQVDELAAVGAVELFGRTEDVPAALTDVGVIVSSSVREGSPLAVLEGTASGAVPVVRDWPFFRHLAHGPRTIYPADWVVADIDEAVERILATTSDETAWKQAGTAAQDFALSSFDLDATRHAYEGLLFGF